MLRYVTVLFMALWAMSGSAVAAVLVVNPNGTGAFRTIQACADAAQPGDRCVVTAGTYPERVRTARSGLSEAARITFEAQGVVTMLGFNITHAYITVSGFDITGYSTQYDGMLLVDATGHHVELLNNTVRDGTRGVYGIYFYTRSGQAASGGVVRGNTLTNLRYTFLATSGRGHLIESNTFSKQNSWDYIRLWGANLVIRRNVFWQGTTIAGEGNHPDWLQTFGMSDLECQDILIEENWVTDLQSQFGQLNSMEGSVTGVLATDVRNITFRRNVIANMSMNGNIGMPGATFVNNTFFRLAYGVNMTGLNFSASLTRGDVTGAQLRNNVFLAGGERATLANGGDGFYALGGASFSREVLAILVTGEDWSACPAGCPNADGIRNDLISKGYFDWNGKLLAPTYGLAAVSQLNLSPLYAAFKDGTYARLIETRTMDQNIRRTFSADYNYVAGAAASGFPGKRSSQCSPSDTFTDYNFCEEHGINGGDPRLQDLNNLLGPDGQPFTLDDGLKPLPSSPLCARGEGAADIGAYSCNPSVVFANSPPPPTAPSNLRVIP